MVIQLQNITHQYQNQCVLDNISAEFHENKISAVIGRSGSGKSTLLQLINGLVKPTQGFVRVHNVPLDYSNLTAVRLKAGYVVQGVGLFPHLTVSQNISLAGKIAGKNQPAANRVLELMDLVSLPKVYLEKYPHQLSGGEQQRVGICRALFLNPSIILMDEPFGALDPITRYEIHQEVLKLQKIQPRTILLVTHDMREAQVLADYILVLEAGKVQQYDLKKEVIENPGNDHVRKLITASLL
jgi:osmoprotectant transport system ATP-binding protein